MDQSYICEVFQPTTGRIGSGYFVAPDLVLTALHVVADQRGGRVETAACIVRPFGDWQKARAGWLANAAAAGEIPPANEGWAEVQLCWPPIGKPAPRRDVVAKYRRRLDLALLRVTDPKGSELVGKAPRASFNLAGSSAAMGCKAVGYPRLALIRMSDGKRLRDLSWEACEAAIEHKDVLADTHTVAGIIYPAASQKNFSYNIYVQNDRPTQLKLWRGMSGAAVFDDDGRIIGVVTDWTREAQNGCLVAERIASILNEPELIEILKIDELDRVDSVRRNLVLSLQPIARIVAQWAERAFERNLIAPLMPKGMALRPSEVFVRPQFRRRPGGTLLIPPHQPIDEPLDLVDVVASQDAVLVVGEPGSGKSFAAADLVSRLAASWASGKAAPYFPLLLMAKDISAGRDDFSIDQCIARAFLATTRQGIPLPDNLIDRARAAALPILLVIDGVDEIIGDEQVNNFLDWINATARNLSGHLRVLLFTRPLGLDPGSSNVDRFTLYQLLPFNGGRRSDLVRRIYAYFGKSSAEADFFAAAIDDFPAASLLDNPAILSMLAIASIEMVAWTPPRTRSDIVLAYIDLLLAAFERRLRSEFSDFVQDVLLGDPEVLRSRFTARPSQDIILSTIGYLATDRENLDDAFFEAAFADAARRGAFRRYGEFEPSAYAEVTRQFVLRVGVLIEQGAQLVFSHNLVREYLAADYLSRVDLAAAERELRRWRMPRWRETLLMVLPIWLREAPSRSVLVTRLREVAETSYDGALFCGELLLELPLLPDADKTYIMDKFIENVRQWNVCANFLMTLPNANPGALVRRWLRSDEFKDAMIAYLESMRPNYCPFTGLEFVRLLSEVGTDTLVRLGGSGTPFIQAYAARMLLDAGHFEEGNRVGIALLKGMEVSIELAREIVGAIAANGQASTPILLKIVEDEEMSTCVRIHAAALLAQNRDDERSVSLVKDLFFGTAHADDLQPRLAEFLVQSRILHGAYASDDIAPTTVVRTARLYLTHDEIARRQEDCQSLRELLVRLTEDPLNKVDCLSVADLIEPAIGSRRLLEALQREAAANDSDKLSYATALGERGDFTLARELLTHATPFIRNNAARILADAGVPSEGFENDTSSADASSARGTDHPLMGSVYASIERYKAAPGRQTLEEMVRAERTLRDAAEAQQDEDAVTHAAAVVAGGLAETGRNDLLRVRIADAEERVKSRAFALQLLANNGDAEGLQTLLADHTLPIEIREELHEGLGSVGLKADALSLRVDIIGDGSVEASARARHLALLAAEDASRATALARDVAGDGSAPPPLLLQAVIHLAALHDAEMERLARLAAEEPGAAGNILNSLVEVRPFCVGAARIVLEASRPAPVEDFSRFDKLIPETPLPDVIFVLAELVSRLAPSDYVLDAACGRLSTLLRAESIELHDEQRAAVLVALPKILAFPEAPSLASSAVLLWDLVDNGVWVATVADASAELPGRYPALLDKMILPRDTKVDLARRFLDSPVPAHRARAVTELFENGAPLEIEALRTCVFADAAVTQAAVLALGFLEQLARYGFAETFGDEIGRALAARIASGPAPFSAAAYAALLISGRFGRDATRESIRLAMGSKPKTFLNRGIELLGQAAMAECNEDFGTAIRSAWSLCLRWPAEQWLRDVAVRLSQKDMRWTKRLYEDELSFYGRLNNLVAARAARDALREALVGTHFQNANYEPEHAERRLRAELSRNESNALAWGGLAALLERQGRMVEEEALFDAYRSKFPQDSLSIATSVWTAIMQRAPKFDVTVRQTDSEFANSESRHAVATAEYLAHGSWKGFGPFFEELTDDHPDLAASGRRFLVEEGNAGSQRGSAASVHSPGEWDGLLIYGGGYPRDDMRLELRLAEGRVSGSGTVDRRSCVVRGSCDRVASTFSLELRYESGVPYILSGLELGRAISGRWRTDLLSQGSFLLWPRTE